MAKKEVAKVKKAAKVTAMPKSKVVNNGGIVKIKMEALEVKEQTINDFSDEQLFVYGSYVVEDRAVPDFRDGLKPVHRAVLWSLAGLGLRSDKAFKKSARTVGDAIGKYHPHGDSACYGAMVTIANSNPPLVWGQGGYGKPDGTPASAYRYTEAKMSKFTDTFLLDSQYLKVVPHEPNFSNDDKIPLYLPALLPTLFFITSTPPPAYGVKVGNPAFSLTSVSKVVIDMLNGKEYSPKKLAQALKITHPFGCIDVSTDEQIEEMMKTGKGSVQYMPIIDTDVAKRTIKIRSFCPGTLAGKEVLGKTLVKLADIDGVKDAYNTPGKNVKGSGPYGALIEVSCAKNMDEDRFDEVCAKVDKIVKSSVSYRLGVTIRKGGGEANKFKYVNYVEYFGAWIKYRIKLEERLISYLMDKAAKELHLNEVYLYAVKNRDKLLSVLGKVLASKEPAATLAKALKMPVEDAEIILERKVKQLAALEASDLEKKIKGIKAEIKGLKADQKEPGARAARDTAERVRNYMKKPDPTVSGLPVE
jgi:topoisomerase-4 subunit A